MYIFSYSFSLFFSFQEEFRYTVSSSLKIVKCSLFYREVFNSIKIDCLMSQIRAFERKRVSERGIVSLLRKLKVHHLFCIMFSIEKDLEIFRSEFSAHWQQICCVILEGGFFFLIWKQCFVTCRQGAMADMILYICTV